MQRAFRSFSSYVSISFTLYIKYIACPRLAVFSYHSIENYVKMYYLLPSATCSEFTAIIASILRVRQLVVDIALELMTFNLMTYITLKN